MGGLIIKSTEAINQKDISYNMKYILCIIYALIYLVLGLTLDSPKNIFEGMLIILQEPSVLMTDYIEIAGRGAPFVNGGIVTLMAIGLLWVQKIDITGVAMATLSLLTGFSLFGKNILNVCIIILGVFIYSKIQRDKFNKYLYVALLGTCLGPVFSFLLFDTPYGLLGRILLSTTIGLLVGMILPSVATSLLKVHQGFVLYNVGFASGLIGTMLLAILKAYDIEVQSRAIWSEGNNLIMGWFLFFFFIITIVLGYIYNGRKVSNLKNIFAYAGKLMSDFVALEGFGITLINMGINGLLGLGYVLLIGGELSGPVIGGILTMYGFGAYGKHIKNMLPIFGGLLLGSIVNAWTLNEPGVIVATLFATGLAPIPGKFGWPYGIVAGFLTAIAASHIGMLHGGLNLYNVGFTTGIVAIFLIPIIEAFKKEDYYEA
ncbi:uncharacterized protein DUF1576 [Natranaerovirga hydrolytica]|uniref:Uncharacterized protein DUF1576 n=1 Tax=Natranaerovirga hydrolytica TaxID=680378 RepID=A0A4V6NFD1_9FIRM|nr:DUF1576 domain-containing protein [Natranaerovirga hydrolytica]TCK92891.1 uncharacterized protein DUF1576 [Natranaerovirga hydrolytica]